MVDYACHLLGGPRWTYLSKCCQNPHMISCPTSLRNLAFYGPLRKRRLLRSLIGITFMKLNVELQTCYVCVFFKAKQLMSSQQSANGMRHHIPYKNWGERSGKGEGRAHIGAERDHHRDVKKQNEVVCVCVSSRENHTTPLRRLAAIRSRSGWLVEPYEKHASKTG